MPNIKPISDLRNYTEVLKQVDASNRVYLTRNGHGEYGILTMSEIDELDRCRAAQYRGEKTIICSSQYVIDKYGIYPDQYAYFKSLVGDTADNIKGAEKIGIKTAALLLRTFGSLENIISNAEKIDKPSIKKSILENTDRIRKNYELIKLRNNQLLPYDKCDLEFMNTGKATTEVLRGIGIK